MDFPGDSDVKEPSYNRGDLDSDPWVRKIPGGATGYPLEYSGLENLMHRGTWQATVHGSQRVGYNLVTKQQEQNIYMYDISFPKNTEKRYGHEAMLKVYHKFI